MPTHRSLQQHLGGLHSAMLAFARHASTAASGPGLDVPVPTCPDWTLRRLIGHQGAVHRWATADLQGRDLEWAPVEKAGRRSADPVDWLRDGAIALVESIVKAPDDVAATTFLHDAPAPRVFWARRQCHETTVHAVDALAAALGHVPSIDEVVAGLDLDADLALDGVDELVMGFVPRSTSRLRPAEPTTLVVAPTDVETSWTVRATPDAAPVVTRHEGPVDVGPDDLVARAGVVHLYLALWHRTPLDSPVWPLWLDTAVH